MKIGIFHATAGHGHRVVAEAIHEKLNKEITSADELRLENSLEFLPERIKKSYPEIYYQMVKRCPMLWGTFYELLDDPALYRALRPIRSFVNRRYGKKLLEEMKSWAPDVLVSTHFLTAELFGSAKKRGELNAKLITVITDFYPHTFWVNESTDLYCVMSEEGRDDLIKRGVDPRRIKVTGIPIAEKFSENFDRDQILSEYHLEKDRLTLLLTSGSFGLESPLKILRSLEGFKYNIQAFVVCGQNKEAFELLQAEKFEFPVKVLGFSDQMHKLMAASDVLIAKPGGATTSESLALGLPMFSLNPIPGQETRNVRVLRSYDAYFVLKDIQKLPHAIQRILEDSFILEMKKRNIKRLAKPQATQTVTNLILDKGEV